MKRVEVFGMIAGICTTSSFVPQVYTIWSMRPTPAVSISLPMYILFTLGVIIWAIYGIKVRAHSIIIMNAITSVLALSILVYKCVYG